ncbi:MAG: hypothetical protein ACKVS9_16660 [Phycisphaerae bacterium]
MKRLIRPATLAIPSLLLVTTALGQTPNRPIITQVFNNPAGTDGPTGRDPANMHQEFVQIYLPTSAQLGPGLSKDSLKLTFYEIEGDSGNSERGFVNLRVDLRPFDLDPSNGITAGAIARPSSGVVILAWVDYNADVPPTDLAGTPATRVARINGGITTTPAGCTLIAINGGTFGGTTNFVTPLDVSLIDVPDEHVNGVLADGSNAYLLVNRDSPAYASLADRDHPELGPVDAALPSGAVLGTAALFDAFAGNDDSKFSVLRQPYAVPTGLNIDLEDVLPAGGAFSLLATQVAESGGSGYIRRLVDRRKTTEDATAGNESPALDSSGYLTFSPNGPIFPRPTSVVFTNTAPRLSIALPAQYNFRVLAGTTGRPGLLSANVGGDFPINISVTPGSSSNPSAMTFSTTPGALGVLGQTIAAPRVAINAPFSATSGAIATAPATISAVNAIGGQPAVQSPTQNTTITATVVNPTRGSDAVGAPFETTVFAAVRGFGAEVGVANEFAGSTLGTFISSRLNQQAQAALGRISTLLSATTNLEDYATVLPITTQFPALPPSYVTLTSGTGESLATKILSSAKVLSPSTTYIDSISGTPVKAIDVPLPETLTRNGLFASSDEYWFSEPTGSVGDNESGFSGVTTTRTFELAIIDSNVTPTVIEGGGDDDFGIVVQVGQVRAGALVTPGEFVFLSYAGGFEGEDIDSVDVPGTHATTAVLLDLDQLDTVLGAVSITRLILIDASGNGTLDPMEVVSLNAIPLPSCPGDVDGDQDVDLTDLSTLLSNFGLGGGAQRDDGDLDGDGDVDLTDLSTLLSRFGTSC